MSWYLVEPSIINPGKQDYLMVPVLFNLLHAAMLNYATRDLRVDIRIYFGSKRLFHFNNLQSSSKVLEAIVHELLLPDDNIPNKT